MKTKGEWRVLYDPSGAIRYDDPTGAEYTMVYVVNGKIRKREESRSGFTHKYRENMKQLMQEQMEALDKPYITEKTKVELKGL